MPLPRPFALVQTEDQWLRCAHQDTALIGSVVELAFETPSSPVAAGPVPTPAGLAFDSWCRLYHSIPEDGRLQRQLWAPSDPQKPAFPRPEPVDLFAPTRLSDPGDFYRVDPSCAPLVDPRALAIDLDDRLLVAEASAQRIQVFDLWSSRLLRSVAIPAQPLDMAVEGDAVMLLLGSPAGLARLGARTGPSPRDLPKAAKNPGRLAVAPGGELFLIDNAGAHGAMIISEAHQPIAAPFATDIEFLPGDVYEGGDRHTVLVAARRPGEDFLCLGITSTVKHLPPLKARGYDGRGIVRTPDHRIGFWTARGFRHAIPARVRYAKKGRVTTFLLDSGQFRNQWGRLFLDACIPNNTSITVEFVAADEPPSDPALARTPPGNVQSAAVHRPELSPAMPPGSLVPANATKGVYRRDTGCELPWARIADGDPFETYEAEILTGPGRFLWVFVELEGDTRFTPRLRSLRAEYPSHDLTRRLPKVFSRDAEAASFLHRYLAMFDGTLGEWDAKAAARHALLDPGGAPPEVLPWLGSFVGMVLDERWSLPSQRQAIREAIWLFRFRGTLPGLKRFLEMYLNTRVIIIEKFRLRGLGTLGDAGGPVSRAILGAGFRVGGEVGESQLNPLAGSTEDAFDTHAHRFTVIIPASLSDEQMAVVRQILDVHRPAHTLVDECTVGAGMRVGRGLLVELTSIIGRTGGFRQAQIGGSVLSRGAVIGRPSAGTVPGASVLGWDSRVG